MKPEVVFGLESASWPALLLNADSVVVRANAAAGISRAKLSHAEVLATAGRVKVLAAELLKNFAELYGRQQK